VAGNGGLSRILVAQGLFDEYRLGLVPLVLENGKVLFGHNLSRLKLLESRVLSSGCLILRWEPRSN
jgi:dihydrofolate reductase